MVEKAPKSITAKRSDRKLTIDWKDGHHSEYPFNLLRAACPCATCRGGHGNMSSEPPEDVFEIALPDSPETMIERIESIGGYGIQIEWGDHHHDGIYTWHYLRALCPCDICRNSTD